MSTKILSIVGARPQFIKFAAVSKALQKHSGVKEILVHTGQHYDENMSRVFFRELDISPATYNLGVGSGTHGYQSAQIIQKVEDILIRESPACIIVYGDTNSTLGGALAGAKLNIPIAHVESGLRSWNRKMPEEVNRVVTDHLSDILFTPTETASQNLYKEGICSSQVYLVGDVMYDATLYYAPQANLNSKILQDLNLKSQGYALATVHRAENTSDSNRLKAIFKGLIDASKDIKIVLPIHPRTRKALQAERLWDEVVENICAIDPVGYLDMIQLEQHSRIIITDSGGVQKEAFFHKVPCLTLRDETEWVELLELGCNHLVSPSSAREVCQSIEDCSNSDFLLDLPSSFQLYGGGKASMLISDALVRRYC